MGKTFCLGLLMKAVDSKMVDERTEREKEREMEAEPRSEAVNLPSSFMACN